MPNIPFVTGNFDTTGTSGLRTSDQIDTMLKYNDQFGTFSGVTNAKLLSWADYDDEKYTLSNVVRDSNDALVSATVTWPNGATGTFTTDSFNSAFPGAIDAFHITYVPQFGPSRTLTQPLVTRDVDGKVIMLPPIQVT